MSKKEAAFRLTGKPGESLRRAIALLSSLAPENAVDNIRLGGGTALAVRWEHRHSTDIDLAVDAGFFENIRAECESELRQRLARMADRGEIKRRFYVGRGGLRFVYSDTGEVSLSAARSPLPPETGWEIEANTRVPLAPVERILLGKLVGRVFQGGRMLARDGYDLASAFIHAPEASAVFMRRIRADWPDELDALLRAIENGGKKFLDGRALLLPLHPSIARDPWRAFAARPEVGRPGPPDAQSAASLKTPP